MQGSGGGRLAHSASLELAQSGKERQKDRQSDMGCLPHSFCLSCYLLLRCVAAAAFPLAAVCNGTWTGVSFIVCISSCFVSVSVSLVALLLLLLLMRLALDSCCAVSRDALTRAYTHTRTLACEHLFPTLSMKAQEYARERQSSCSGSSRRERDRVEWEQQRQQQWECSSMSGRGSSRVYSKESVVMAVA